MIGRPNVGKSSLVNKLLGEERVIVADEAGTTRDPVDTRIEVEGRPVTLVDTAGLRRRTKVAGSVDYYAQLRSERAAERAQVAIVMCDAAEGVTSEDFRIAEMAMNKNCCTVIALNKWDVDRHRPRGCPRPPGTEAAPAPTAAGGLRQERARPAAADRRGPDHRRPRGRARAHAHS